MRRIEDLYNYIRESSQRLLRKLTLFSIESYEKLIPLKYEINRFKGQK